MKKTATFSTDVAAVCVEDGILYAQLLQAEPSVADFRAHIAKVRVHFGEIFPIPLVMYSTPDSKGVSKELREFLSSDEMMSFVNAVAVITDSLLVRMAANLFLKISRPRYPMQLFTDEAKAVDWLRSL